MSIAFLKTELETLSSLAKKRNVELQRAIEKSLQIADSVGDEADIRQLRQFPEFVSPFFLACSAANAKSCASALQCLQTMAIGAAIAPQRLSDLLSSLLEAAQLGISIQLKILQLLPMLVQSYAAEIRGDLVIELLTVCAELQGTNKLGVVHNTAYATLQQLITALFDRIGKIEGEEVSITVCDTEFVVDTFVRDSVIILDDLCDVAEGRPPKSCKFGSLPLTFTLEFLELTLTNHAHVFHSYKVFSLLLRQRISPLLIRLFKETAEFSTTLRTIRIFYLLIRRHLKIISAEAEVLVSLLTQTIAAENPAWKRVLCLEVFQGVFLEMPLVCQMHELYDSKGRTGLASLLNIFSSSLASGQLALSTDVNPQILSKQATMRIPCIDLLDKTEPPRIPPLYLDYLILVCVTSLADGLNRLAVRREKEPSAGLPGVFETVAAPLLNSFTILLGVAMDLELYRQVVRSVQRLAHSAGILSFDTARDDYMKLLAQFSRFSDDGEQLQRAALCIRALFNVGYALGNQLGGSWAIIVRSIKEIAQETGIENPTVHDLLAVDEERHGPLEVALRRLIDQSDDFTDQAFIDFVNELSRDIGPVDLAVLHAVCLANLSRLAQAGEPWDVVTGNLLAVIHQPGPLRRKTAAVLDHVVIAVMKLADEPVAHRAIITAISRQGNLPTDQNDADAIAVQAAAIAALNQLLDQYGGKLKAGWEEVFEVISSGLRPEAGSEAVEIVKGSFQSLELVCSDFLDNLPYPCVVDLTLCLDRFARQQLDLNTAFTATSRFWAVCDHLMTEPDAGFPVVSSEQQLLELSKAGDHKKVALWMLAQIKLGQIANEPQHQVKTGAIQIFFRLFEAHGRDLSPGAWETCHKLVINVVMAVAADEPPANRDETLGLIVAGLGSLWATNLEYFAKLTGFKQYWAELLAYFGRVSTLSPVIALAVYTATMTQLESPLAGQLEMAPVWRFWTSQPTSPEPQPERVAVHSLEQLVQLYAKLAELYRPAPADEVAAIGILAECAKYPHAGAIVAKGQLTPLQQAAMGELVKFDVQKPAIALRLVQASSELSGLAFSDVPNPGLFSSLSAAAQTFVLELLNRPAVFGLLDRATALSTMQSAVALMENVAERQTAVDTFIKLMPKCLGESGAAASALAVQGGRSLLEGGSFPHDEAQDIANTEAYLRIVESIDRAELWAPLLKGLLVNSLVYERALYRRAYFERQVAADDPLAAGESVDGEADELSLHGTIEPPRPCPRAAMAYFCLATLDRLAQSAYAGHAGAARYHAMRMRMVLCQYIGDAQLRGREPMVDVLRQELLFVLRQLRGRPGHRDLLSRCISCGDPAVLATVEAILRC